MTLSPEEYQAIEELAGCNYGPREIAIYLARPVQLFINLWEDPTHPIRESYDRGVLVTEAEINIKLATDAKGGNNTAIQQFYKVKRGRQIQDAKLKHFG